MKPYLSSSLALLPLSACLALAPIASAATLTWDGTNNTWPSTHWDNGSTLVAGTTITSADTATINSGTVTFAGNDTFGAAANTASPAITLNSGGTLASGGFYNAIWNPTFNGGTLLANGGVNGTFGAFAVKGTITVGGSSPSSIALGSGSNNAVSLGQNTGSVTTFNVANVTGDSATDFTIATPLNGTAGVTTAVLVKNGAGQMVVSGPVSLGQIVVGNAAAGGILTLSGATGGWTQSGTQTNLGLMVGTGSGGTGELVISGGTHTLGGNGYANAARVGSTGSAVPNTGSLTITAGTIRIGNASATDASLNLGVAISGGTPTGTITASGGSLEIGRRLLAAANTSAASATINLSGTGLIEMKRTGSNAEGDLGMIRVGSGAFTLNLDGGTYLGSAIHTDQGASGRTFLNYNGGTLKANASTASFITTPANATQTVKAGGLIFDSNGFNVTLGGSLVHDAALGGTADGGITKNGAGRLVLSTSNTFTGPVTINGGTLCLSGTYNVPVSVNSSGTLSPVDNLVGTLSTPSLSLGNGSLVEIHFGVGNDVVNVTTPGGLSLGSSSFVLLQDTTNTAYSSNGTYTLIDYDTSFTGSVSGISIANPQVGKFYSVVDDTVGTTIQLSIADATSTAWTGATGTWSDSANWTAGVPGPGTATTFGNIPASPVEVVVDGPKTVASLIFDNSNSFALAGSSSDIITLDNGLANGLIQVNAGSHFLDVPLALARNAAINLGSGTGLSVSQPISGPGKSLSVTGTGSETVIFSADNTYSGGTTVTSATLQIGTGGNSGSVPGNIVNNGALIFNRSDDTVQSGVISGNGSVSMIGSGNLTLSGSNTFTGPVSVIGSGTLTLSGPNSFTGTVSVTGGTLASSSLPGSSAMTLDGGIFRAEATIATNRPISVGSSGGTLEVVNSAVLTTGSTLAGAGNTLAKSGSGSWIINSATGFTGTLNLNGGTTTVSTTGSFGAGPVLYINAGATLNLDRNDTFGTHSLSSQSLTINGGLVTNGTLLNRGFNAIQNLGLANGAELRVTGTARALADGDAFRFEAYGIKGTVTVSGTSPSFITNPGNLTGARISIGGTVDGTSSEFNVADVTGNAAPDLTVSATLKNNYTTGFVQVSNGLVKTGAGTLLLTAANAYTGGTTVNAGTITITDPAGLGSGPVTLTGGTVDVSGLTLSNSFTGNASSTVISSGATFNGAFSSVGTVTGAATLNGTFQPGAAGAASGLTTIDASLTLGPASTTAFQLAGATARGTDYDALNVTSGTLFLDGTVTVTLETFTPVAGQTFDLIDATLDLTNFNVATDLILPALDAGLVWNTSSFATDGKISVVSSNPYTGWQASKFTAGELADPLVSGDSADPDGDGLNNALEYAFGSEPKSASAAFLPKSSTASGQLVLSYLRPVGGASGVTYTVETQLDLQTGGGGWTAATPAADYMENITTSGVPAGFEQVTITFNTAVGPGEKRFGRVFVSF